MAEQYDETSTGAQASDAPRTGAEPLRRRTMDYYGFVDSGDTSGLLDWFAADAEYRRPGYEPMIGTEQLRAFYEGARVIDSGVHQVDSMVVDAAADDGNVAVRGRFTGRLKDGTEVEVGFADFIEYRRDEDDSLRARLRITYFDSPAV
ncbi:MAG: nuclear transport factor 2 family protein [Nesterenkonia sp.]|uniref:nuclear transport factor 2 family protein n=1 Tax=Nesterenkonia marinintestina TaxID=2979865 RepID=UPI0021C07FEE|nr:nuclear transport factor 2 family protein [Nesterenkonia sp. GX14115]MDO5493041.1 nuclear transport factor 2 family protein [Nesterenkonia sp.]